MVDQASVAAKRAKLSTEELKLLEQRMRANDFPWVDGGVLPHTFSAPTMRSCAQERIVATSDARLSDLPLLSGAERNQLLVTWNDTSSEYSGKKCAHDLFVEQAARTPAAVAVIYEDQRLTYGELDDRSNRLAHYLRALGVGPEVVVGLCIERSLEMVVGLLGVLKAGGAYLPLDPTYPCERLAFMLSDAQASVLLTQAAVDDKLRLHAAQVVRIDADWHEIADHSAVLPPSRSDPDNLAYVIYTSGSTGKPKGVMGLHRGIANRFAAQAAFGRIASEDICCQKTSIGFVDSIFEILGPLFCGAALELLPNETGGNSAAQLLSIIAGRKITRLITVPSLAHALISIRDKGKFASLRSWTLSGEALNPQLARQLTQAMPRCRLVNLYGSSEVSADVTFYVPTGREQAGIPIGKPICNTQIYILNGDLDLVPKGAVGELYVGGVALARGYLGSASRTAERFLPSPFERGARIYRTGDLARWHFDGELELVGRTDHQIKIRGVRVELGEIETALMDVTGVSQAAVVAHDDGLGRKKLVAYIVPGCERIARSPNRPNTEIVDYLRETLRARLPPQMVPTVFCVLDSFPLTPSGKTDRRGLPVPQDRPGNPAVVPRSPVQEVLADVWSEVLGAESAGVSDDFFELGGHSLLAFQIISRIKARFSVDILPQDLLEAPTIEALALVIEDKLIAEVGELKMAGRTKNQAVPVNSNARTGGSRCKSP